MISSDEIRAAKRLLAEDRRDRAAKRTKPEKKPRLHVNAKADRGRTREPPYLAFIRRQPCAARALGGCEGPVEAAHVRYSDGQRRNPGLQVKPSDEYTLPLCASHHRTGPHAQHSMNERVFWEKVGTEPTILMSDLRMAYEAGR